MTYAAALAGSVDEALEGVRQIVRGVSLPPLTA